MNFKEWLSLDEAQSPAEILAGIRAKMVAQKNPAATPTAEVKPAVAKETLPPAVSTPADKPTVIPAAPIKNTPMTEPKPEKEKSEGDPELKEALEKLLSGKGKDSCRDILLQGVNPKTNEVILTDQMLRWIDYYNGKEFDVKNKQSYDRRLIGAKVKIEPSKEYKLDYKIVSVSKMDRNSIPEYNFVSDPELTKSLQDLSKTPLAQSAIMDGLDPITQTSILTNDILRKIQYSNYKLADSYDKNLLGAKVKVDTGVKDGKTYFNIIGVEKPSKTASSPAPESDPFGPGAENDSSWEKSFAGTPWAKAPKGATPEDNPTPKPASSANQEESPEDRARRHSMGAMRVAHSKGDAGVWFRNLTPEQKQDIKTQANRLKIKPDTRVTPPRWITKEEMPMFNTAIIW
jgi:hypothetical protein